MGESEAEEGVDVEDHHREQRSVEGEAESEKECGDGDVDGAAFEAFGGLFESCGADGAYAYGECICAEAKAVKEGV